MIERDYIMRMIQMLTQALARIVFRKNAREYPEALKEIQTTSKHLLGVELDVLRRLSDIQMIDLLSLDLALGLPKCHAAGMLLKEEAEILEFQKKESESRDACLKALSLLTETAIRNNGPYDSGHAEAIDFVAGKLKNYGPPVYISKKLFRYYEIAQHYAKARYVLLDILKMEPSFAGEGLLFYARLGKKLDDDLRKGNISRTEIADSVNELRGGTVV